MFGCSMVLVRLCNRGQEVSACKCAMAGGVRERGVVWGCNVWCECMPGAQYEVAGRQ